MALRRWLQALWLLLAAAAAWAQPLQPVPELSDRVIDQTGTLGATELGALKAKLAAFEAQAGPQIVVLMVASTKPEDIASFAQRVGETWKIGRREVGDGLLLVVAKDDRKIWIAPAKALEGAVPDLAARQIVRDHISPYFKQGNFAGGLDAGIEQLMARIRGENLPAPAEQPGTREGAEQGLQLDELAMFFFVAVPVLGLVITSIFGRKLGSLLTAGAAGGVGWWYTASMLVAGLAGVAALVLVGVLGLGAARGRSGGRGRSGFGHHGPPIIFGGGGGSSWGGGGGGFSSGGGGDFGGGGAGGDW